MGHRTHVGDVLLFCRDAVVVLLSPRQMGHRTHVGDVLLFCRDAVVVLLSTRQMGHRTHVGDVLLFCRDAVIVLLSPRQMGHRTHVGTSYSSAETQSLYSWAPGKWVTGHTLGTSYSSAETKSLYSWAPGKWVTGHTLGTSYSSAETQSLYSIASPQLTGLLFLKNLFLFTLSNRIRLIFKQIYLILTLESNRNGYFIIINKSRCQHGFWWLCLTVSLCVSLFICPYHPSLPEGPPDSIWCSHKDDVDNFLLVGQHRHIHVQSSKEWRHLWVGPPS